MHQAVKQHKYPAKKLAEYCSDSIHGSANGI
jgi:hypothetical protein